MKRHLPIRTIFLSKPQVGRPAQKAGLGCVNLFLLDEQKRALAFFFNYFFLDEKVTKNQENLIQRTTYSPAQIFRPTLRVMLNLSIILKLNYFKNIENKPTHIYILKHHLYTSIPFLSKLQVRGAGKNARLGRVNLILLDELERALATFKSESCKIKESGEHIFALISFADFILSEVEVFLHQGRKVELKIK